MPNGVDAELFSPGRRRAALRERLGIPADAVVAAFVATLDRAHHFKRLDVAIDGARAARRPRRPPGRRRRRRAARRLPRRAPRRPGSPTASTSSAPVPHAELPEVLRAADLFLLTTEPPESFGIVLIEAMACGLPAIATDYPGVRAVVDEGETGLLVPRGDAAAVADGARASWSTRAPSGAREMGERGPREGDAPSGAGRGCVDRMDDAYARGDRGAAARRSAA